MARLQRLVALFFFSLIITAFVQCARRGSPSGGPKDETPPVLIRAEPENMTPNFKASRIRLYFDEFIKLNDVQNQLIVSPPLKYNPEISPQGGTRKYVEVRIKDTLQDSTTYTLNFGQSIQDNNEGNPNSFLSYVFSTGDYIDSLTLTGVVRDGFNKEADEFVSVMLYEIDTSYTDSTIYKKLPNYITNTLDSTTVFTLQNLKEGEYALFAIRDDGKNNLFDQRTDKIAFMGETVVIPTDTAYVLTLFREIPDYSVSQPSFASANRILFGYSGNKDSMQIRPLSQIPDSVRTLFAKEPDKDTINFWFTPFEIDSLLFEISNPQFDLIDTFTIKPRKLAADSLLVSTSHRSNINFEDQFYFKSNIPISSIDTSLLSIQNKDSIEVAYTTEFDSTLNKLHVNFEKEPNETFTISALPDFITDFFEETNDTLKIRLSTGSYADYGNLRVNLNGDISYPVILQLTDDEGETKREIIASEPQLFEFNNIDPGDYLIRLIFDSNGNGKWDTGNYLKRIQPEQVIYYPQTLEVRANWELEQSFTIGG